MQVREKADKFQQRSLDGFFKAGLKSCQEHACADRQEQRPEAPNLQMPDALAMEVEMEVSTPGLVIVSFINHAWLKSLTTALAQSPGVAHA